MRFLDFNKKWDIIRVSELLEFYSTNSLSWETLSYDNGVLLNLHYGLIHSGLPTQIDCSKNCLPYIKSEHMPKHFILCKEGDVVFADASEDTEEVGKVVEFKNCNKNKIVCGLHTIHARDRQNKTVVGYKGYAFSSIPFHHQIRRIAQGTKIYSISTKNFEEVFVGIPSESEQTKIATFLQLIDERIETQSKIIENLESQMKAISDRIFNFAKGTPITLKKLLNERNERTTTNNQHEVLSSTVKGLFLQKDYFNKNIASENNIGYKIVRKNDIIISPQNLWLGNITYNDKFDIGIVSPSYKIFEISDLHNKYYVAYMMRTKRALYSYVCVSEQGASVVRRNLNMELFEELVFTMPDINTQNKIGSFLKKFSDKISLEKAYLDLLKKQKNFLLKNMFI